MKLCCVGREILETVGQKLWRSKMSKKYLLTIDFYFISSFWGCYRKCSCWYGSDQLAQLSTLVSLSFPLFLLTSSVENSWTKHRRTHFTKQDVHKIKPEKRSKQNVFRNAIGPVFLKWLTTPLLKIACQIPSLRQNLISVLWFQGTANNINRLVTFVSHDWLLLWMQTLQP